MSHELSSPSGEQFTAADAVSPLPQPWGDCHRLAMPRDKDANKLYTLNTHTLPFPQYEGIFGEVP